MRLPKMTNAPHGARHPGDRGRNGRQGDQSALLAKVSAAISDEFFDDVLLHVALAVICSTRLRINRYESAKFNF